MKQFNQSRQFRRSRTQCKFIARRRRCQRAARLAGVAFFSLIIVIGAAGMSPAQNPPAPQPPPAASAAGGPQLDLGIGHTSGVLAAAVSPDGKIIATGSQDRTVKLWDAATGKLLFTLSGHTNAVIGVAFAAGDLLRSASKDGTVKEWDAPTGTLLNTITGPIPAPTAAAFSHDGMTAASGGADGKIALWNLKTAAVLQSIPGRPSPITALAFSKDDKALASGLMDGYAQVWDPEDGSLQRTFQEHALPVRGVAFSPDGALLANASDDGEVSLGDIASGKLRQSINVNRPGDGVRSIVFSPDGARIATGGDGGPRRWETTSLWNTATGDNIRTFPGRQGVVQVVAFSPDGRFLLSGSRDSTVLLYDVGLGTLRQSLGRSHRIASVAFSPDGTKIASGGDDNLARIWSARTGELIQVLAGHQAPVQAVAFSPDNKMLATASQDKTIRVWSVGTGTLLRTLRGHTDPINAVAFSPDGATIASGGGESGPSDIRLWNAADGKPLRVLTGADHRIASLAFSPDSKALASAGPGEVYLWDPQTGTSRLIEGGPLFWSVAFSPNGKTLAAGSALLDDNMDPVGDVVKVWNARTGALQHTMTLKGPNEAVTSLAFSPDNRTLLAGSRDGNLRVWDSRAETLGQTLSGHLDSVLSVAVSPDGKTFASVGVDNTLRIWNPGDGKLRATLVALPPQEDDRIPTLTDWLALLPEGYYDSSPGAGRWIRWRVGRDLFPVAAYEEQLRRPDLVRKSLAGEVISEDPGTRRLVTGEAVPPQVIFTSPTPGQRIDANSVEVQLYATDDQEVKAVQVLVDGRRNEAKPLTILAKPITILAKPLTILAKPLTILAKPIPTSHRVSQEFKIQVPLPVGEKHTLLTAIVTDKDGLEGRADLDLDRGGSAAPTGDLYVLAVGVSHYKNPAYNLKSAASDAAAFADLWKPEEGRLYRHVHTTVLANEGATVPGVTAALTALKQVGPEDSVALFVSGHGVQVSDREFYFATHEVDVASAATVSQTALPWTAFQDALAAIHAHRIFLFLDACHSGNALGDQEAHNDRLGETLARHAGVLVFASSRGSQYSYELDQPPHGAFTQAILEAIRDGKADFTVAGQRDRVITAEELLAYLRLRVPQLTEARQTPTVPLLIDFGDDYPIANVP